MPRIVPSILAEMDADEIWLHIAEDSPAAADRLIAEINSVLEMLAANPAAGRLRKELGSKLRSFPVGNYVVIYSPMEDGIALARILHGARDLEELF